MNGLLSQRSSLSSQVSTQSGAIPWATLHALRHTFATRCFRHGCNVKQVQVLLGHHSAAFTLETYVHLMPEDLPALEFLDSLPGVSRPRLSVLPKA